MKRLRKVTLQDVAHKANVSVSTVSRALSGFEFVEESTRSSIIDAAQELGYVVKNERPKTQQPKTILMLTCRGTSFDAGQEAGVASVEGRISSGVVDICQTAGIATRIQPVNIADTDSLQLHQDDALLGIIYLGGLIEANFAAHIQAFHFPFVVAGAAVQDIAINCVSADYAHGAEEAVHHFARTGRTHIGLVNGSSLTTSSQAKYRGFRLAMALNQLDFDESLVQVGDFSSESGYHSTEQILKTSPEVDAILYASDAMAIGGLRALKEAGRAVPDDVSVIGFHDTHVAQYIEPQLSSVQVDLRLMGRIATSRIQQLSHEEPELASQQPPWTIIVPTALVLRQSA